MATHRFRRAQPIIYGVAGIFIGEIATFFLNPVLRSPGRATTSPALPDSRLESLPINTPGRSMAFWSMHSEPHFLIQMIPHHQDAVAG
jgi:hypothetical protein